MSVDIEVVRRVDCAELLSTLEAKGFHGTLVEDREHLLVRVTNGETAPQQLQTDVLNAIDAWVEGQELPLVVTPLDEGSYCLHPPSD